MVPVARPPEFPARQLAYFADGCACAVSAAWLIASEVVSKNPVPGASPGNVAMMQE